MSDSVRQVDIEDVLSSIRRLVADEATQRGSAASPAAFPPDAGAGKVEKLVLTPALRVADPSVADPGAPVEDASGDVAQCAADAAPKVAGSGPAPEPQAEAPETGPEPAGDAWEEISLEERIAELEAAISNSGEEWEPDGSELDGTSARYEEAAAADAPAPAATPEEATAEEAAPETAQQADADQERELDLEDEPMVLDEEMLRDLVSEIVRQELQGALGERITRNVRKLVRREINRVMASRDFE
ncbi:MULTISPECIES: hypothetical protein [Actibacterium]|uniref:Type IV secretory pathway VirB10-like protein n=1 Tax=Actibacterium naphthalenivorans TaxID=1614693 RepID=A0A840CC68_9RHOB|nr:MULTISPECIES: hypothetical protein [Actibacterium]ALG90817.1 hypothetical protein TQ29_12200 [Actibacterium sp. EMB200-NS6]MBB4022965.1 type IV secretory pathway VirB10-like protein [Actibacterium naphthalenivorans]